MATLSAPVNVALPAEGTWVQLVPPVVENTDVLLALLSGERHCYAPATTPPTSGTVTAFYIEEGKKETFGLPLGYALYARAIDKEATISVMY